MPRPVGSMTTMRGSPALLRYTCSRRIGMAEHVVQQLVEPAGRSPNLPHQHTHHRDAATACEMRTSVMGSDGSAATFSSDGAALPCTS